MATYREIQEYVNATYGFKPQTCWIAHMKEVCGLERKDAVNRQNPNERKKPCPKEKQEFIRKAFIHFGMVEKENRY